MKIAALGLLAVVGGWLAPTPAQASLTVTNENTRWERAAAVTLDRGPAVFFGALGSTGDARFYTLDVEAPGTLAATLDVPMWADPKFHPQFVVYQPDTITLGPPLAMAQPPDTIALVYSLDGTTKRFEAATQITTAERFRAEIELPVSGKYYLAVYNADQIGGRFRLTLTEPSSDQAASLWAWPKRWWVSHLWANPSLLTMFVPLAVLAVMITIAWTIIHWRNPAGLKGKTR